MNTPETKPQKLSTYRNDRTDERETEVLSKFDEQKTVETIKILIAMLYTIKNHLRADWGVALSPGTSLTEDGQQATTEEYKDLLPPGLKGYEHRGLGLTLQLAVFVEDFVALGVKRDWFHNAASGQMISQLNRLIEAYGSMEVIRLVPIPVAHLIHHKQTLALYCSILPIAMAAEIGWWAIPLVAFVAFTLYGIEGIAHTFEDPFGIAKMDINMDDIVADARREVEVLLSAWQISRTRGSSGSGIFQTCFSGKARRIDGSSGSGEYFSSGGMTSGEASGESEGRGVGKGNVRFVVSDMSGDYGEQETARLRSMESVISPGNVGGNDYFGLEAESIVDSGNGDAEVYQDIRESRNSPGTMVTKDYMSVRMGQDHDVVGGNGRVWGSVVGLDDRGGLGAPF